MKNSQHNKIKIYYYGWCPYCNQDWFVFKNYKGDIYVECEECTTQPSLKVDLQATTPLNLISNYAEYEDILDKGLGKYIAGYYELRVEEVNRLYSYAIIDMIFNKLALKDQILLAKI